MKEKAIIEISEEVQKALSSGTPVVALESVGTFKGIEYPQNVEIVQALENIVRRGDAVPATIAMIGGKIKVGITNEEIEYLGSNSVNIARVSRKDMPIIAAIGGDGAMSVSAALSVACACGIKIFATGGIGGVHKTQSLYLDISQDLDVMRKYNMLVVCAGFKPIMDIGNTLEKLETQGVPVLGYKTERVPSFYSSSSDYEVDYRIDSTSDIAAVYKSKLSLGTEGAVIVVNPVSEEFSMEEKLIAKIIDKALKKCESLGITGKKVTAFVEEQIDKETNGHSRETHEQLLFSNARLATEIAKNLV